MNQPIQTLLNYKSILVLLIATSIFSCQSVEEKSDGAYEEAKESKVFTDDSLEMESEMETPIITKENKVIVINPWVKYATDIEKEIKICEKKMAQLRVESGTNEKTIKRITALENEYHDLQKRMMDFNKETEANFEKFKSELKTDLIELDSDLNELSTSIKPN